MTGKYRTGEALLRWPTTAPSREVYAQIAINARFWDSRLLSPFLSLKSSGRNRSNAKPPKKPRSAVKIDHSYKAASAHYLSMKKELGPKKGAHNPLPNLWRGSRREVRTHHRINPTLIRVATDD